MKKRVRIYKKPCYECGGQTHMKSGGQFEPHMMYDPKTGKEVTAKTPADHNKYAKMGYTHEKPTNEVSADLAKRAFDARVKKYDKAAGSASGFQKAADRASGTERSDRLRRAADHQKRMKDMEKKMDRSARKGGFDAQDRYKKVTSEAVQYKVDVEGLPPTFMTGKSPAEILSKLRKIVKQPSMIKSVERHTDMEVRKAYRNKAQGREIDEAGTPERLAMIRKAGEKINKEKKKAERDAKRAIAKDKDLMGEAVTYHGNPNKDDDARNAARRKRLAKQDNKVKLKGFGPDAAKGNMGNPVARASLRTEASVVPSKDGKKLVPMKKHSGPKSEPVPNDQFGLPKLQKEAAYGSQAQRMMSPLQKARQDKEKADRDRHGNLNMMKGRPKKLGEISQDLKQRYHDKAKSDYGHQQFTADIAKEMGAKDAEKHYRRKQRNRMAGIARAKK